LTAATTAAVTAAAVAHATTLCDQALAACTKHGASAAMLKRAQRYQVDEFERSRRSVERRVLDLAPEGGWSTRAEFLDAVAAYSAAGIAEVERRFYVPIPVVGGPTADELVAWLVERQGYNGETTTAIATHYKITTRAAYDLATAAASTGRIVGACLVLRPGVIVVRDADARAHGIGAILWQVAEAQVPT
jgi:hypothetical protein